MAGSCEFAEVLKRRMLEKGLVVAIDGVLIETVEKDLRTGVVLRTWRRVELRFKLVDESEVGRVIDILKELGVRVLRVWHP